MPWNKKRKVSCQKRKKLFPRVHVIGFFAFVCVLITVILVNITCSEIDNLAATKKGDDYNNVTTQTKKKVKSINETPVKNRGTSPNRIRDKKRSALPENSHTKYKEKPDEENCDNSVFTTRSDQVLAMAMSVQDGTEMAPIPFAGTSNTDFINDIKRQKIVFNETDSKEVRALKEKVLKIREEILSLIEEGCEFGEIMEEHRKILNENVRFRNKCIREAQKIFETGDVVASQEFVTEVNNELKKMGIKAIEMPISNLERKEKAVQKQIDKLNGVDQ